jgi:hypothetical protein
MATEIKAVLVQRGNRYGSFSQHAVITQSFKNMAKEFRKSKHPLEAYQQEALDMIFHKIGRILNGDPNYDDSWIDIAGYAQLVVDKLHEGKKDA